MSTKTSNFEFIKPELSDGADITQTNGNWDKIDKTLSVVAKPIAATSTDGINYYIDPEVLDGSMITNGTIITIIPNMTSVDIDPLLYIDGLVVIDGYDYGHNDGLSIGMKANNSSGNLFTFIRPYDYIRANEPLTLQWYSSHEAFVITDSIITNAEHLSGQVPIESGGTGAKTKEQALENLGAFPLDGSEKMTGSLKIKDYGEVDGSSSLTYLKSKKDINNFRYLRIINPLLTDYTKEKAIQWGNVIDSSEKTYDLYGSHNKPAASYTGNGSATSRTVAVGGVGEVLTITSDIGMALVTNRGAICLDRHTGTVSGLKSYEVNYQNGVLTIAATSGFVNANATSYWYQVL